MPKQASFALPEFRPAARPRVLRAPAILCSLLLAAGIPAFALPAAGFDISAETRIAVRLLIGDSLLNGNARGYDESLADRIGPRLTGSTNYVRAVDWGLRQFESLGLSHVHTEEWNLPNAWRPKTEATGRILTPVDHELHIHSAGWSPSTPPLGVEAKVVYVPNMDIVALDGQRSQLAGAIALIDDASFGAARSADKIFPALQHLRSLGIKALLLSGGANGTEVSDTHNLSGGVDPLPEAQIGIEDVLLIKRLQQHDQVTVHFSFANTIRNNVSAANVVAQITGAESPNEVVLVGAHLDSWQSGTGAQDNGTGVSMALKAARAMLALPRPSRRTVRFVFFGGEEQGLLGSSARLLCLCPNATPWCKKT
jgi:carboxypeptidase Q